MLLNLFFSEIKAESDTLVVISTEYGNIKFKLYKDTPVHRHNFITLVRQGFYDNLLLHKVISGFIIQGGDPNSKNASDQQELGSGELNYTLPPEIKKVHYHKKGALAAARKGDDINPEKFSSACQFFIVHGKNYSQEELNSLESRMKSQIKQNIMWKYLNTKGNEDLKKRYLAHQQQKNSDSLNSINTRLRPVIDEEYGKQKPFQFSDIQRADYERIGGAPRLDESYTVFGEVIEGIEVIDRIAEVEVKGNNRPVKNIVMKISIEVVNN